ncbi:hypothetical protein LTR36_009564 [Oleoguttula mirabilis]|uniref:PHD-type domain-containing protein n=1 Tax=Oleoguttula mirabilis TaxID=1507867 RepID=A0AAV9JT36_9PEZI|nr:hypothetical protein LTR36_009564 [Oleoguttula mirabilis]
MSFSLSSLLNPEPAEPHFTESVRKDSLPPIQHVQSPDAYHPASSPRVASAPSEHHFSYPPATAQEAAQALASLSASCAPPPTQYYGFSAPDYPPDDRRTSFEHRSSSSHGASIELPPPSADGRKMSSHSPTLEAYQVTSRSPEQRRSSMIAPVQPGFTLPPIQGFSFNSTQQEQTRRASLAHSPMQGYGAPQTADSHVQQSIAESPSSLPAAKNSDLAAVPTEPAAPPMSQPSLPAPITTSTPLMAAQMDGVTSSPADIKQEGMPTPRASSPQLEVETHTSKKVASLKNEHGLRTQSPLRESSVPVPSTEMSAPEQAAASKKRPAKKGTATARKAPPSKKRKLEVVRSETPSSRASKPAALKASSSSKGTPANSSPAPSNRSRSAEPNDEYDEDEDVEDGDGDGDGDVYCICRKPDNGTFMIGCDGTCDDWYHGKCVGIEERDKNLIDKYMCPRCANAGIGRTSWKRMCRRGGCRQPARVGKSKGGKEGSKYCSEDCGVLYFREMVSRTRNREDTLKSRSSRRKGSTERMAMDDDLGAKGGALAAGEVKSLIEGSKTAEDFKRLGEGVLSPPPTPDGKDASSARGSEYTEAEAHALEHIHKRKNDARRRHQVLKDRMKFVTMIKQAASRTATEKELKPKEYCGYDPRLEWTEEQFAEWRDSAAGRQAFELETLATEHNHGKDKEDTDIGMTVDGGDADEHEAVYAQIAICDRKKCARHLEWGKLAVDDVRFEMSDNSDNMRALDREERGVKERAALRGKSVGAGGGEGVYGGGSVEVHGLGLMGMTNGEVGGRERDGEGMEVEADESAEVPQGVAGGGHDTGVPTAREPEESSGLNGVAAEAQAMPTEPESMAMMAVDPAAA